VAMELAKYGIDIAALCETRLPESGNICDLDYNFYWSGRQEGEKREAGVCFAVSREIASRLTESPKHINDRIMKMPLGKDNFATFISVYAPTMTNTDEAKEAFYSQLICTLKQVTRTDKLILMGDFNARKGTDHDKWPTALRKHGLGKCNSNGELLLSMCSEFELTVTNTLFKQRDERKTTWMHPLSKYWHIINFILTRHRDKNDFNSTRVMRRANCWSDHQLLRSKVAFPLRQKYNKQGPKKPSKLNTAKLKAADQKESLQEAMDIAIGKLEVAND